MAACEEEGDSCREVIDGVIVHRLRHQFNISSTPITLELPRLLREIGEDFDIIHVNFPNPWTELLYLIMCRGRRAIITYHSDIFRRKGSLSYLLLKAYHPFIRSVLANVSAVIASSPNCIENSPFLSPQREKCEVIPMPVDVAELDHVDPGLVAEAIERFGRFVLFVGRLVEYKGVQYLIEAIARMRDVHLVIVGRGHLEDELKQLVQQLGLQSRVVFLGKIPDTRLRLLYHACRCFVLPSISHAEAFGIVLAEAMACSKPVISTQLQTGTSFVNIDGVTGYVVPPKNPVALAEKIDRIMSDDALYECLGAAARKRAQTQFDRSIVVKKTIDLYRRVLAK